MCSLQGRIKRHQPILLILCNELLMANIHFSFPRYPRMDIIATRERVLCKQIERASAQLTNPYCARRTECGDSKGLIRLDVKIAPEGVDVGAILKSERAEAMFACLKRHWGGGGGGRGVWEPRPPPSLVPPVFLFLKSARFLMDASPTLLHSIFPLSSIVFGHRLTIRQSRCLHTLRITLNACYNNKRIVCAHPVNFY